MQTDRVWTRYQTIIYCEFIMKQGQVNLLAEQRARHGAAKRRAPAPGAEKP